MAKQKRKIVLEADYTYQHPSPSTKTSRIAKRVELLLRKPSKTSWQPGSDELIEAIEDSAPLSLLVDMKERDKAYTLLVVGESGGAKLLDELRLDHTEAIPDDFYTSGAVVRLADSPLAAPQLVVNSVTVWMETEDGECFPLPITKIGYAETTATAKRWALTAVLAVLDLPGSSRYKAYFTNHLNPFYNVPGDEANCSSLRSSGNFFLNALATLKGCPQLV